MKPITLKEYNERFEVRRPAVFDPFEIEPEDAINEGYTFYDNGAVKNSEGDFVVKCEDVRQIS